MQLSSRGASIPDPDMLLGKENPGSDYVVHLGRESAWLTSAIKQVHQPDKAEVNVPRDRVLLAQGSCPSLEAGRHS